MYQRSFIYFLLGLSGLALTATAADLARNLSPTPAPFPSNLYHKKQLGLPLTSAEGSFLERRDMERAEREKARLDPEANEK